MEKNGISEINTQENDWVYLILVLIDKFQFNLQKLTN